MLKKPFSNAASVLFNFGWRSIKGYQTVAKDLGQLTLFVSR